MEKRFVPLALAIVLGGCMSQTTLGTNQGPVTGAAGPGGAVEASAQLERCERPIGTVTLVESQDPTMAQQLAAFGLGSPIPVLRLIMQQSGCFRVVDRGAAMQTVMQERALARSGEAQAGSRMGGGQIRTADLALTPNIIFSGRTGGGGAGLVGAILPGWGGLLASGLLGALKFTSAQSVITLTDVRTTEQIGVAQGTATAQDLSLGAALFGAGGSGALGGAIGAYANSPEGRVIAASLMDAHNNLVKVVRGMPPLPSVRGRS